MRYGARSLLLGHNNRPFVFDLAILDVHYGIGESLRQHSALTFAVVRVKRDLIVLFPLNQSKDSIPQQHTSHLAIEVKTFHGTHNSGCSSSETLNHL